MSSWLVYKEFCFSLSWGFCFYSSGSYPRPLSKGGGWRGRPHPLEVIAANLTRHRELPSSEGLGVCLYMGVCPYSCLYFILPAPFKTLYLQLQNNSYFCRKILMFNHIGRKRGGGGTTKL